MSLMVVLQDVSSGVIVACEGHVIQILELDPHEYWVSVKSTNEDLKSPTATRCAGSTPAPGTNVYLKSTDQSETQSDRYFHSRH